MPKKILIFSTAYYPLVGGAEVAIKEITDRIPDVQFDLITAKLKKNLPFREKIGNVTVYRLGFGIPLVDKILLPIEGALFARHLQKKNKYDAYWCIMATFASGAAYLANIFSTKKTPIILNLQEGDSKEYLKTKWFGLVNLSTRLAVRRAAIITVLSNYLGERARKFGFKGEVKLVPNGVDIKKFNIELSNSERLKIREWLGLEEKDVALVTSSRLNVKNGVGDVIKALVALPENVKFVILGTGELQNKLQNLAKDLSVENRVVYKGFVSHDMLPKYLKACDIFIRASLSEGFGNSFIEAMAAGIPVIATPVGGIVDFLVDPAKRERSGMEVQTGYFCKPNDPASITTAINRCISDPNKKRVIETAKKMAIEKYNWDIITMQMREVFNNL